MSPQEKSPQEYDAALAIEAQDLWSLLSSQFEDDLKPETYSAYLTLPIEESSPIYNQREYRRLFSGMTSDPHRQIAAHEPWRIGIGYDQKQRELGVSSVRIPLAAPTEEAIVYQASSAGMFIPTYETKGITHEVSNDSNVLRSAYIGKLLLAAGYDLRRLGSTPSEMRLKMAELIDQTSNATIEEQVTRPVDVQIENGEIRSSLSLYVIRILRRHLDSPDTAATSSSVIQKGKDHSKDPYESVAAEPRPFFVGHLQAISEVIDNQTGRHNQLVIEYKDTDFTIHEPVIYKQTFREVGTEILGQDDTKTYRRISREAIETNLENLQRITMSIGDELN